MILHNKYSKEELLKRLESETFKRKTLSFYHYVTIDKPWDFRNKLYQELTELECNGRIYVAREGINAQMNVPEHNKTKLLALLDSYNELQDMPIKWALEEKKHSFYKMIIKVRKKIVADGLNDADFDPSNVGRHLSPMEFHRLSEDENTIVVDMRNHYESAIGRFKNAWCPDVECKSVLSLSEPERFVYRNKLREKYAGSQIFRSRLRPKLYT
ncbi:MAG: hypothetical protein Q8909_03885 [Bacteroidota bacterium]|nr:hypothetical protein [Bacteroidota bacterium]